MSQIIEKIPIEILNLCKENQYTYLKIINNKVCAINRFLFTYGVMIDLDEFGYKMRFCFNSEINAINFIENWDGVKLPEIGVNGLMAIK